MLQVTCLARRLCGIALGFVYSAGPRLLMALLAAGLNMGWPCAAVDTDIVWEKWSAQRAVQTQGAAAERVSSASTAKAPQTDRLGINPVATSHGITGSREELGIRATAPPG
jgi:hypothetical protein